MNTSDTGMVAFLRRMAAALVVVFALLGPHIALLSTDPALFGSLWLADDAGWLLTVILLVSLALALIAEVVVRLRCAWLTRLGGHCFVAALAAGVLANIRYHLPHPGEWLLRSGGVVMNFGWMAIFALLGYSFAKPGLKLVLRCRQACQILTPVALLLVVHLARMAAAPAVSDPLSLGQAVPAAGSGADGRPVYLFVFDCWSYPRTFDGDEVRSSLKHLATLADQSIVFHDAESLGGTTGQSMPRLLFQRPVEDVPANHGGCLGFERDGVFTAAHDLASLFTVGRSRGDQTVMVGCSAPYKAWVGSQVDVCRSYGWPEYHAAATGHSLTTRLELHALHALGHWTDPWSGWLHDKLADRDRFFMRFYGDIRRDVVKVLSQANPRTFAVLHCPMPHPPFLVNEDGTYCGKQLASWEYCDVNGYERNLAYADRLLGKFVATMKSAGTYDRALIVLTADHGWWPDREFRPSENAETTRHVPLFVKLPGQSRHVDVAAPFSCRNLQSLIEIGLEAGAVPTEVEQMLQERMAEADGLTPSEPMGGGPNRDGDGDTTVAARNRRR